jgi:hypothetical protein
MPALKYSEIKRFNENPPWALRVMRAAVEIFYYEDGTPKKFNDAVENENAYFSYLERYAEHELKKLNLAPLEDEKAIELPKPVLLPKPPETTLKRPLNEVIETEAEAVGVSRTKPPEIGTQKVLVLPKPLGYQPDSLDLALEEFRRKADVK